MKFSSNCELMDEACEWEFCLGDAAHLLRIPRGISAHPYFGFSFNESVLDYGFSPHTTENSGQAGPSVPRPTPVPLAPPLSPPYWPHGQRPLTAPGFDW